MKKHMHEDRTITCVECGGQFTFSVRDQEYYESRNFDDPKRCKTCRKAKKRRNNEE